MNYKMENSQSNNKIFVYLLTGFFIIFIVSGLFLLRSSRSSINNQGETATTNTLQQEKMIIPTSFPTKGFLSLTTATGEATLNSNVEFEIIADSEGENISAFDVILRFDPLAFDFIKATSLDPVFQIYPYKKDNRLSLTAVKTSQGFTPSIFADKPVIKITFKAKKVGEFPFAILSSFDKESTKFVNEKTEVINPEVNDINLVVQ